MSSPEGRRPTWPGLLNRLLAGQDLSAADTAWAMREVMTGEATPVCLTWKMCVKLVVPFNEPGMYIW